MLRCSHVDVGVVRVVAHLEACVRVCVLCVCVCVCVYLLQLVFQSLVHAPSTAICSNVHSAHGMHAICSWKLQPFEREGGKVGGWVGGRERARERDREGRRERERAR